ncbi:hypothetical protein PHYPSEUDO_011741 [Phytophthora pseudosyringae]|uniref:Uncharacterized protein n=1 Tax=Phytophthora pseudosyringae TaxID=221518 RepID=A0A8T1V7Y6_9STRA|nr:hypothetical protein PHYPSEUDO_011741 [Phytophthora pseudosyringae]
MKDLFAEMANLTPSATLERGVSLSVCSSTLHDRSDASEELSIAVDAIPTNGELCSETVESSFVSAAQTQLLPAGTPMQLASVSSQSPSQSVASSATMVPS